jgi:glycosyltransferase involved in cell wall biosynthesis
VVHRLLRTYEEQVDLYIAPSDFAKDLFVRAGLPESRVWVKPNFVDPDPGARRDGGGYGIFVGRLSQQKGLRLVLAAWRELKDVPLKIVGAGPLRTAIEDYRREHPGLPLEVQGWRSREEIMSLLKGARFLLFPSEGYETFGRVVVEAFACGVPVIASCQGAAVELVRHEVNGLCFAPGKRKDLAAKVRWIWEHPADARRMGKQARAHYAEHFTAEVNYHRLMEIYEEALRRSRTRRLGAEAAALRSSR